MEIDDELAASRDEVMSLKDDLSASEAKLVLAQDDLRERPASYCYCRPRTIWPCTRNEITPVTSTNDASRRRRVNSHLFLLRIRSATARLDV